jgi:hypothetical protein
VGCPRLRIQYIRSYPPYLEGVSSIRNLRTRHAVVTKDTPNMRWQYSVSVLMTSVKEYVTLVLLRVLTAECKFSVCLTCLFH